MSAAAFRTERCLERLLCDKSLYLSELDDVQRLMKGRKIEPELNTMCAIFTFGLIVFYCIAFDRLVLLSLCRQEFPGISKIVSKEEVGHRLEIIRHALELAQLSSFLPSLVQLVDQYKLCPPTDLHYKKISLYCERLSETGRKQIQYVPFL